MKDSFVLYKEYKQHIDLLNTEEKAQLLDAIFDYANGEEPEVDGMAKMAFSFIRSRMDKDAQKYEEICEKRKIASQKAVEARNNQMIPNGNQMESSDNQMVSNGNQMDTDNDATQSLSLSNNNINTLEEKPKVDFEKAWDKTVAIYPQKFSLVIAKQKWAERLIHSPDPKETATEIFRAIKLYLSEYDKQKPDDEDHEYVPYLDKWFDAECDHWINEYKRKRSDSG